MQHQYHLYFMLLLSALLTGCAAPDPSQNAETTSLAESTAAPETAETTEIPAHELISEVRAEGVSFTLDGTFLQTIPMEQVPDAADICICDYDSDGFPDVFLPDSPHNFRGHYYHYDDAAGQLVLWDALNFEKGGTGWYMEHNPDGTLLMKADSIYGTTITRYRWEQAILMPTEVTEQYFTSQGLVEDLYQYAENGNKILCRRSIHNSYDHYEEIIEYPLYFRITPDAVHVMKNTELLQELPLGSFWDSYAALGAYFEQQMESPTVPLEGAYLREPECYLGTEDYDFDGHADLYIPDTLQGNCTGTYYRYDAECTQFVRWDVLNAVGCPLYADAETERLTAYTGTEGKLTAQDYQWNEGKLIPLE